MAVVSNIYYLNLIPNYSVAPVIHCSYDDTSREIEFRLLDGATAFSLPDQSVATISGFNKFGNSFGPFPCSITSDEYGFSSVKFVLNKYITEVVGESVCEITITNGEDIVGSANFKICVERSPLVSFGSGVTVSTINDTVTPDSMIKDVTAHDKDGDLIIGTIEVISPETYQLQSKTDVYHIAKGSHNGTGTVGLSTADKNAIVAGNIKDGVTILGVEGSIPIITAETYYLQNKNDIYTIASGIHDGTGTVGLTNADKDAIVENNIMAGTTILGVEGAITYNADTREDTVTSAKMLDGITAHNKNGNLISGSIQTINTDITITDLAQHSIPQGYHTGDSSHVQISQANIDKIIPGNIKSGVTILGVEGSSPDTSNDTVTSSSMLTGITAHDQNGAVITGEIPTRNATNNRITTKAQSISFASGYYQDGFNVSIDETEQGKILPANIVSGVTILGVEGSAYGILSQEKTVTPRATSQTIVPDSSYNALFSVVVEAIPYSTEENAAGGITVTIG